MREGKKLNWAGGNGLQAAEEDWRLLWERIRDKRLEGKRSLTGLCDH